MPPGGEMYRFPETLGENVPVLGRHECLPYSINAKRVEIYKHQFICLTNTFYAQKIRRPEPGSADFPVIS